MSKDFKIVAFIGNPGAGKTTIIQSIENKCFSPASKPTNSTNQKAITIPMKTEGGGKYEMTIKMIDVVGQDYEEIIKEADAVAIVCDAETDDKVEQIKKWLEKIDESKKVFVIENFKVDGVLEDTKKINITDRNDITFLPLKGLKNSENPEAFEKIKKTVIDVICNELSKMGLNERRDSIANSKIEEVDTGKFCPYCPSWCSIM